MVPGIGTTSSPRARTHASASCPGSTPFSAAIARRLRVSPAQLALAWVLAQGDDVVPIPGTKHTTYLEENAAAAAIRLTPGLREELDRAAPRGATAGARYPEAAMRSVNR